MAVTLTQLTTALRASDDVTTQNELMRLQGVSEALVSTYLRGANCPQAIQDEAVIRLAGYLFDAPAAGTAAYANAGRNSGAWSLLAPHRIHRAGSIESAVSTAVAEASADNPVTNVTVSGTTLTVTFANGTTADYTVQGESDGTPPTPGDSADETARDAAATAQARADAAFTLASENADDISAMQGQSGAVSARGDLIAVIGPLTTASRTDTYPDNWTLQSGAPTGYGGGGDVLDIPERRSSNAVFGHWVISKVDGIEFDEVLIPWGGGAAAEDRSTNEFSIHGLAFGTNDHVDLVFTRYNANSGLTVQGDDDTLPDNSTIEVYLAVIAGGTIRGTVVQPSDASAWALEGDASLVPDAKRNRKAWLVTAALNIAMNAPAGAIENDLLFEFVSGTLKIYRRLADPVSPATAYWNLIGTVTGGGASTAGEITAIVGTWWSGHPPVAVAQLPFALPNWLSDPINHDIPYAAMDSVIESWAVKDTSPPIEIIPDERLPVARLLPSVTGADDGKVAKVVAGQWAAGVDATGGNTSGRFYIPGQFVRAEDVQDPTPVEDRGKVYLLLRYSGLLTSAGGITAIQDHGAGFARYTGTGQITRTIATAQAHDFASTFGTDSSVVLELLTALPGAGSAAWGVLYGISPNSGQVEDIYFRREEHTREQLWVPARLHSQLRNIHGFTDIVSTGALGYARGGGLSPESGIAELVEEKDVLGNITTRVIVPDSIPLNSPISVLLFYKSENQSYNTERELPLFRDASFTVSNTARYVSAVYMGEFKFTPGTVYTIKWRRAGDANDLIISSSEHMRRIIDDEDLLERAGNLQKEIYELEDRVAELESSGGAPARYSIDMGSYEYRTGAQLGGSIGRIRFTASYPAGTTQATFTAKFKTGFLQHDSDYTGDLGVTLTESSATALGGYNPQGQNAFLGERFTVSFNSTEIQLNIPTNAALPTAAQNGWELKVSLN